MRVLIIGASGLIGSTMLRVFSERNELEVFGTIRRAEFRRYFSQSISEKLIDGIDVEHADVLPKLLAEIRPDVVVNCAGLTKHKPEAEDPLIALPINALMPHRLADLCGLSGARLIHISSDCVFSGEKGNYDEGDFTDARDIYGRSKALGEVSYPHAITVRTSTIGHELQTKYGLLDWFLSQEHACQGFSRAIFSGLPTLVLAQVVRDVILPRPDLNGLYHVAADPINKFDLLKLIADVYGKTIDIQPNDKLKIDRSLNPARFQAATGYVAPSWPQLIQLMHDYK